MSALSDDSSLHDGVIVCSVGARYSFYCANISRTIFINPTKKQEGEYAALLGAQEAVIAALRDGAPASAAADAAIKVSSHYSRHQGASRHHGLQWRGCAQHLMATRIDACTMAASGLGSG